MIIKPSSGWIGVDLDGTLAHYDKWRGPDHIGAPVPAMLDRVKNWLKNGKDVRIFTARVGPHQTDHDHQVGHAAIEYWCIKHLGKIIPITATKDFAMVELWDDRAVTVKTNTGEILTR